MSMLGHQTELHRPTSSENTAWTSYAYTDIDDTGTFPYDDEGDAGYAHDTDSGTNEQSWSVNDITAYEGGKLREFVVYLCWKSGYSGADSVRILLDATHYNCTKVNTVDTTTDVWEAWVAYPDVATDDGFTAPEVKVTSPASEVRLSVMLCQSVILRNAYILRPDSDHASNEWGDYTAIDEPIFLNGWVTSTLGAVDDDHIYETGKTTGTWALTYTDDIPSTSGGSLAFIQIWGRDRVPTRLYVNDTAYTDDYIEDTSFTGFGGGSGPHTWYRDDDITSGLSNMGLGVFQSSLGAGVDGDDFKFGYLLAAYDDDSYGHARLVPTGNVTSARFYDRMDSGMDAKTEGTGNYSYGLGNETSRYSITDMPSDLSEVTGLTLFIHWAVDAVTSNNTYLNAVRIVESDESTALTSSEDASSWTLSTSYLTYRLDFDITGSTDKTTWDSALIEFDFDINGTGSNSFRMAEVELVMEYKKSPAAVTPVSPYMAMVAGDIPIPPPVSAGMTLYAVSPPVDREPDSAGLTFTGTGIPYYRTPDPAIATFYAGSPLDARIPDSVAMEFHASNAGLKPNSAPMEFGASDPLFYSTPVSAGLTMVVNIPVSPHVTTASLMTLYAGTPSVVSGTYITADVRILPKYTMSIQILPKYDVDVRIYP